MSRRRLAFGVVLLASCNWIAGIHELPPNDARGDATAFVDGPLDTGDGPPGSCANGMVRCNGRDLQTCAGDVWQTQTCDFTCAEVGIASQPSCVAASNMTSVATACGGTDPSMWPVLDPGAGGTITYASGSAGMTLACRTGSGADCGDLTSASIDTSNLPGVAWFCVQSLVIEGSAALVVAGSAVPAYALGIVSDGDAHIDGTIALDGSDVAITNPMAGKTYPGARGGPGGFAGGSGDYSNNPAANGGGIDASGGKGGPCVTLSGPARGYMGGGGGGGNSTAGGAGGSASGSTSAAGGGGGSPFMENWLAGGGGGGATTSGLMFGFGFPGGGGGGALQISARGQIAVGGTISAGGGSGYSGASQYLGGTGGGAGGTIVLEAPLVTAIGVLIVDGGDGGNGGTYPPGGGSAPGGTGATGSAQAQRGASITGTQEFLIAGGGGGGAGRIAIHAASPSCPGTVSPTYSCTATALQGSAE